MVFQMTGKQTVDVEVGEKEMGYAIIGYVQEKYLGADFDDAGCDWMTHDGRVYIGGLHWMAIDSVIAADLVDAANILINGSPIDAQDLENRMGLDQAIELVAQKIQSDGL